MARMWWGSLDTGDCQVKVKAGLEGCIYEVCEQPRNCEEFFFSLKLEFPG